MLLTVHSVLSHDPSSGIGNSKTTFRHHLLGSLDLRSDHPVGHELCEMLSVTLFIVQSHCAESVSMKTLTSPSTLLVMNAPMRVS